MAANFQLEIVTPERLLVNEAAEEVLIPGKSGQLGVLPGHAPLITELGVGEIRYRNGNNTTRLAVAWGFAEVLPEKVTILAETAERASEIDLQRAESALARAQERLKTPQAETDIMRAEEAVKRAQTRVEVAKGS